jgi:hypothetical protein
MADERDDSGFDPNIFYAPGAAWVVAFRQTARWDETAGEAVATGATAVISGQTETRRFIAVFSDKDLAERFIAQQESTDLVPAKIRNPAEYVSILERWGQAGFTHVAYDLGKLGTPARFMFPIARAIDEIKRLYGMGGK